MNITEATEIVAMLQVAWPSHSWNDQSNRVYHMGLDDLEYADVLAVIPTLIKTATFAPVPADIRELLGANVSEVDEWEAELPNGEQAWEEVRQQIKHPGTWGTPRFSHPLIERTVKAFGWLDICQCDINQLGTLRAQVERFHNQFRVDSIAALKRGMPMEQAILPFGEQRKIAGLVPVALPEGEDRYDD